jgi:hypothetical protein
VTYYAPQPMPYRRPARPWRKIIAVCVAIVAIGAAVVVTVLLLSGPSAAEEDAYIDRLSKSIEVGENRQAFIDAGAELCGVAGRASWQEGRQVLIDHGLRRYAMLSVFIAETANEHLC